jgi:hypothetical protein
MCSAQASSLSLPAVQTPSTPSSSAAARLAVAAAQCGDRVPVRPRTRVTLTSLTGALAVSIV